MIFYSVIRNTPFGNINMGNFLLKEKAEQCAREWNKDRNAFDKAWVIVGHLK
jgi:hypothetical protein